MSITIASIVKNEADRFLPKALECWAEIADRIRILDNCSSDDTPWLLNEWASEIDLEWDICATPMDGNEWVARKQLFEYATPGADWVIWLDADQVLSRDPTPHLVGNRVAFYVYDMWDADSYRKDAWWKLAPWWQAVRAPALEGHEFKWNQRGWHSSHVPRNIAKIGPVTHMPKDCAVLHYGYATPELRAHHHAAYFARKKHLTNAEMFHAGTIMQANARIHPLGFEPDYRLL